MLNQGRVNGWPAFSDMMFMLALTALVAAAGLVGAVRKQEVALKQRDAELARRDAELERRKERLDEQQHEIDKLRAGCGLASSVVKKIGDCLHEHGFAVVPGSCSFSIEGEFLFEYGKAELRGQQLERASQVADCVIGGAQVVASDRRLQVGLDSVSIEGHADRCGYRDWRALGARGMRLPTERAASVYRLVYDRVWGQVPTGQALDVLAWVTTRTAGPFRPLSDSPCDCGNPEETCRADRRVEIVVLGRTGDKPPNWSPIGRATAGDSSSSHPLQDQTGRP